MNIFYTDYDVDVVARNHPDQHMKMIVETCQMLSTTYRLVYGKPGKLYKNKTVIREGKRIKVKTLQDYSHVLYDLGEYENDPVIHLMTHENHPCCVWMRESKQHYDWSVALVKALIKENYYRKNKIHACEAILPYLDINIDLPDKYFKEPPMAIDDDCRVGNVTSSYKAFLNKKFNTWAKRTDKRKIYVKWTKRKQPDWVVLDF